MYVFAYAVTLPFAFGQVGNGTFAYATTVPFTFLLSGMPYGTLHSLQQHERPGSGPKAHTKHLVDKSITEDSASNF